MTRPLTISEKIIARAAGRSAVEPGEIVTAKVDLAFAHDSSGPRRWKPMLDRLGIGVWDPDRIAIVTDHYVPANDIASATILKLSREFARDHAIASFFDMIGICHVVLPEKGLIRPGAFVAGGDSHSPTGGAFGAYVAGYGATDMLGIVATGETWLTVPETIRVDLDNELSDGVVAKDVMLLLCRKLGMDNAFTSIEFGGSAVKGMTMLERMVLSNMAAELGAEAGVIAPDQTTFAYLQQRGKPEEDEAAATALASDHGATFAATHRFDAASLPPQIAAPHSPDRSADVGSYGDVPIDQAYIGACTGAKLSDLDMAARILTGRKVAAGVRLLVAPASAATYAEAARTGILESLTAAGAIMLPSGCGACAGIGAGVLAAGEVCISSTSRNFKGRMGHPEAEVYLGSPYSVAAAAVAGRIVDPREMLGVR